MCCSLSGSIKGVQGERKRHLPFTLGLASGEGLLIFKSYIPSLFLPCFSLLNLLLCGN